MRRWTKPSLRRRKSWPACIGSAGRCARAFAVFRSLHELRFCQEVRYVYCLRPVITSRAPEIEEQLNKVSSNGNINIVFTPHLIPMNRGILVTAYASLNKEASYREVKKIYEKYYGQEQFIRLLPEDVYPETRWVKGSNYCDINFKIDKRTNRIIVIGAIDNLIKGAAGQAVQNMNIMFGLKENKGIDDIPLFPI